MSEELMLSFPHSTTQCISVAPDSLGTYLPQGSALYTWGMSKADGNKTRGSSISAIERASGMAWADWLAIFTKNNAATLSHAKIAELALTHMPASLKNAEWWAQSTAIAFEQHAGLRVPGQTSTGKFRVSASRTLPLGRADALAAWVDRFASADAHRGLAVSNRRDSETPKRAFHRFSLEDAGGVEVSATPKDETKTILAISHEGLPNADQIEEWRTYWKSLLAEL